MSSRCAPSRRRARNAISSSALARSPRRLCLAAWIASGPRSEMRGRSPRSASPLIGATSWPSGLAVVLRGATTSLGSRPAGRRAKVRDGGECITPRVMALRPAILASVTASARLTVRVRRSSTRNAASIHAVIRASSSSRVVVTGAESESGQSGRSGRRPLGAIQRPRSTSQTCGTTSARAKLPPGRERPRFQGLPE